MITAAPPHKVELLRRRTVGQSLAAAFSVFQQIGRQIITITAAISGPPMLVGIGVVGYWYIQRVLILATNPFAGYAMASPVTGLVVFGLVCALAGLVLFTTTIASILHIYDNLGPEELSVRRVWEEVRGNLLSVFGQFLLLGLMGAAAVFLLAATRQSALSVLIAVGSWVGQWWLLCTFFPLVPVRVVEHASVGGSFRRCMQLARGKRWSNLGMVLLSVLFGYLLSIGFITPYYFVVIGAGLFERSSARGMDFMRWEYLLLLLLFAVGAFVALLYTTVTHYIYYYNLAERTDHWRLMERIEALRHRSDAEPGEVARA